MHIRMNTISPPAPHSAPRCTCDHIAPPPPHTHVPGPVQSGGYKISALEVESAVCEHPDVAECAVLGVPDQALGQVSVL